MTITSTYAVTGMTCGHCVTAVAEEIAQVGGVTGVDVDLASGRVTVVSDGPVDAAAIAVAVHEAGYAVPS